MACLGGDPLRDRAECAAFFFFLGGGRGLRPGKHESKGHENNRHFGGATLFWYISHTHSGDEAAAT